jgi:hypothetical protein
MIYELHGFRVRSEIELPGARRINADDCDLDVRLGESRRVLSTPPPGVILADVLFDNGQGRTVTQTEDGYAIRFFGTCDFEIRRDRRVARIHAAADQDPRLIALLFEGSVIATLLALAGEPVLHASAVAVDGNAIAFAGNSGSGKSTLAALFCGAGARLIADDVLRIDARFRCFPGPAKIRLRQGAASLAEQFQSGSLEKTVDERIAIGFEPPDSIMPPLAAIIFPRPSRTIADCRVKQLPASEALFMLMSHPRTVGWKSAEVIRMQFDAMARIAAHVPIFEAEIPWGPPFDRALPDRLLQDTGLTVTSR